METSERRRATRLALPKGSVSGLPASGRILDVSSSGVKVEVDTRCVFARGEHHRLVLSDLLESVEIEGQVRWTQSNWRDSQKQDESEYFQTAGLVFSRLLSDQPAGIWSSLLSGMERPAQTSEPATAPQRELPIPPSTPPKQARNLEADKPAPAAQRKTKEQAPTVERVEPATAPLKESPEETSAPAKPRKPAKRAAAPAKSRKPAKQMPALEMIEPIDGCTVSQQSIKIICTITKPETITGFRINGVDALVMGDLGTVDLKLQKGANRIVSMVSRRDGTYSTYLLGKVIRSQDH